MSEEISSIDGVTPESVKVLADKGTGFQQRIPKKVPDVFDIEEQTKAVAGALAAALLTGPETAIHTLQPLTKELGAIAAQMVGFGVRQTDHVSPDAVQPPAWITDGVRQEAAKAPAQPIHTEVMPVDVLTGRAPKPPKRIKKADRAVRRR